MTVGTFARRLQMGQEIHNGQYPQKKKSHSLNEQKEFDQCLLSGNFQQ